MSDYLPTELIVEIFLKLSIKSLLQCTNVCKLWYSIIKSTHFISTHLHRSLSNKNTQLALLTSNLRFGLKKLSFHLENQEFKQYTPLDSLISNKATTFDCFRIVDSCNGLFCFFYHLDDYLVILWNPSIRKTLKLPKPSLYSEFLPVNCTNVVGIGFDSFSNDYKVLHLMMFNSCYVNGVYQESSVKAELYSLKTDSWKIITHIAPQFCSIYSGAVPAFVNGSLHWIAYDCRKNVDFNYVVMFDLRNEVFNEIMLPKCLVNVGITGLSILPFGDSSLAVVSSQLDDDGFHYTDIWVMKEYEVVGWWMKLASLTGRFSVLGFRKNGEVLMKLHGGEIASFDLGSERVTIFLNQVEEACSFGYLESLALLDKGISERDKIDTNG